MPFYRVNDLMVHLNLGGKLRKNPPAACRAAHRWSNAGVLMNHCCAMATLLCDFPVGNEGKTCDMPLCPEHAHEIGPNRHWCPKHRAQRGADGLPHDAPRLYADEPPPGHPERGHR